MTPSTYSEVGARFSIERAETLRGAVPYYLADAVYHLLVSPEPADG